MDEKEAEARPVMGTIFLVVELKRVVAVNHCLLSILSFVST